MFEGKNVLVTGSARNTGLGIAKVFGSYGATVFVHGRSAEQVEKVVQTLNREANADGERYLPVAADVACEYDMARAFAFIDQQVGGLDVLVNNACHLGLGHRFLDMPIAFFDEVLAVNLRGYALCAQYACQANGDPRRRGHRQYRLEHIRARSGRPRRLHCLEGWRGEPDSSDCRRVGRAPNPGELRCSGIHLHRTLGHASGRDETATLEECSAGQGNPARKTLARPRRFSLHRKPGTSPARRCWFPAASISSWSLRTARCSTTFTYSRKSSVP